MKTNVLAPTVGAVSTFFVESGSQVAEGDLIMEIECMKMMYQVTAPADGILSIFVSLGMQVGQDQLIAVVKS